MKKASISILKAHLSRYVDAVKSGEEIIVTERGRPVARLCGLGQAHASAARVDLMVREGRMRRPVAPPPEGSDAPADPDGRSLRLLLEERDEGR